MTSSGSSESRAAPAGCRARALVVNKINDNTNYNTTTNNSNNNVYVNNISGTTISSNSNTYDEY